MRLILASLLDAFLPVLALAQESGKKPTEAQIARQAATLKQCEAVVADVQASIAEGKLLISAMVKAKIEAANPDLVVDLGTFKVSPKPKPETP